MAIDGEFGCADFGAAPSPPTPKGGGFVTIYEGDRIVREGSEEAIPDRFPQEDFDP